MYENYQDLKPKEPSKNQNQNVQKFDLEDRTLKYSICVMDLLKTIKNNMINMDIKKQLMRSATSVGANYREANEALGKKDFIYRLKISRKETKETIYWLNLLKNDNSQYDQKINYLINEAREFIYIFTSIITKKITKNQVQKNQTN